MEPANVLQDVSSSGDERDLRISTLLQQRDQLTHALLMTPYDLILYLRRAAVHAELAYPDLSAGDAYRALLLTDEVRDEGFEYHIQARTALERYATHPLPDVLAHGSLRAGSLGMANGHGPWSPARVQELAALASVRCFEMLSLSLLLCGCLSSALRFCQRGLDRMPGNMHLAEIKDYIQQTARQRHVLPDGPITPSWLPDRGFVRREVYPWNSHEPDRLSQKTLHVLNKQLAVVAPKCRVQVSTLPVLLEGASDTGACDKMPTCHQLGLFAKEDIAPGEDVLREYSLLTANNRHKESTCDACGSELPAWTPVSTAVKCPECQDTVFCDTFCFSQAQERYHPALCEREVDSIAKDPEASESDESLYFLLLVRLLAMAVHQDVHPLDLDEIRYIWGDFEPSVSEDMVLSKRADPPPRCTLPFSFRYHIEIPLHVMEMMDMDVYANLDKYDLWVFNTAFAKFRGTASARKSGRDGRPDVAAVHPLWCLANHNCEPNVMWEWGGRMRLWAREARAIHAGDEILNHYCDIGLGVQDRRDWARGSLGGPCMCQRCRRETAAQPAAAAAAAAAVE